MAKDIVLIDKTSEYGEVFSLKANSALTAQYLRVYLSNQREGNAHTKTRGEVAGSGRKPWKQKGTGRARVGSIRNPAWRHGGVSHGPQPKDWSLDLPKKMKAKAFLIALSDKVNQSKAFYVDKIELAEGRTKDFISLFKGWGIKGKTLIVTVGKNGNLEKGSSNIQDVQVTTVDNLNPFKVIQSANIVFEKEAVNKLKEKYAKI